MLRVTLRKHQSVTRMPRNYGVYNSYSCMCRVPFPGYQSYGSGGVILTTQSSSLRRLLDFRRNGSMGGRVIDVRDDSYTKSFMRRVEAFYQSCVAYNMRYCTFTGFVKRNGNYFSHIVKDVAILVCFFVTNFVVLITIVAKIIVHMFFVLLATERWISRTFLPHSDTGEENFCPSSPLQPNESYYPYRLSYDKNPVS